ncbi:uncharacterized protein SAPINGB_P004999 [Magnusiomyces paraingens]|uniref:Uncharacterized protein n=1 Tax=Magnusiomyces paraingens TaxID=2606893 RepID=A0A5E8C0E9_9ASCO|nr:uncharacterized protein SAPINGB_P004999 [Saprochaete ingens]VVT56355.1 unnamed protein product [Saprochaete ingens]
MSSIQSRTRSTRRMASQSTLSASSAATAAAVASSVRITRSKKLASTTSLSNSTSSSVTSASAIQQGQAKRRAALEDLSNVHKIAALGSSSTKGYKKMPAKKMVMADKQQQQPPLDSQQQQQQQQLPLQVQSNGNSITTDISTASLKPQRQQHRSTRSTRSKQSFNVHNSSIPSINTTSTITATATATTTTTTTTNSSSISSSILPLKRRAEDHSSTSSSSSSSTHDNNNNTSNDHNDKTNDRLNINTTTNDANENNNTLRLRYEKELELQKQHDQLLVEQVEQQQQQQLLVETRAAKRARTQPWDDLDAEDIEDPLMVSEYVNDIFDYFYTLERKYMPDPDYMDQQRDLTWETRGVLMDWLVDTHAKLRLLPETLFLAFNIIDRFMTMRVVTLDKIQLVGIAALLIAAKYEEVFPPNTKYFAMLTDENFKEDEILSAERFLLQVLSYELSYPNPLNFLRRISKADNYDVRTRSFGKYFLEVACLDHRQLRYPPSRVAAAAMFLSRRIANAETDDMENLEWTANLEHYSGDVSEAELMPIVRLFVDFLSEREVRHVALFKKYASRRFFKASVVARQWAKENYREVMELSSDEERAATGLGDE